MPDTATRKPVYKMVTFWLALLLVVYALAGFLLLPWWLERQVPEQLQSQMGWQGDVEDIDINPFFMTVDIEQLQANDSEGTQVLSFQALHADLAFWRLFTGTIALEVIQLQQPFVRVDLLEGYGVNLVRDWNQQHADKAAENAQTTEADSEDGEPPNLYFAEIRIEQGQVQLRDFTKEQPETFNIQPLNLTLNDLATFSEDGTSDYTLSAAIGEQQIDWQGDLGLIPFHSNGRIELSNIEYSTIWHFAAPYAPYVVTNGTLSLTTDYAMSSEGDFALITRNGQIRIQDLSARLADADEPYATLATAAANDINFDLNALSLDIGSVDLDQLDADISRNSEGVVNVAAPFMGAEQETENDEASQNQQGSDSEFRWSIGSVRLGDSQVDWHDEALATPADLALSGLNIEIGPLTHALGEPVPYQLDANTGENSKLSARGQITMLPFTLESVLTLNSIALPQFQPYIQEYANIVLNSGQLDVEGNLDIDTQDPTLTGTFSGTGTVTNLEIAREGRSDKLLSWSSLVLNPIELNLDPGRLEIGTVTLTDPDANIIRLEDGSTNLSNLMVDSGSDESEEEGASDEREDGERPEFIFRTGSIQIESGGFDFADRTVDPVFTLRARELAGTISGLTNIPPQQASVRLNGQIGERGSVEVTGSIGTLGEADKTELKLQLDNLAMAELSPYFGKYLGYGVDSGKLRLDLDYTLNGAQLDAANHIVMDQLALGQPVQSDQAIDAPIKLGLNLLRNGNGVIDINLPVSGNLDDPKFRVSQVVMSAFVNLLAKAATSPFTMLGSIVDLAGFSGEELGKVGFVPGEATLASGEEKKLEALASALSERKDLLLNVRGAVAPDLDGLALKSQRMNTSLDLTNDTPRRERIRILENHLTSTQGEAALQNLQQTNNQTTEARMSDARWLETLTRELTRDVQIPPEELDRLAKQRGTLLFQRLSEDYDIAEDQLFQLAPSQDAETQLTAETIQVIVPFAMDSR
ncbi:DUF748 domain-containing protein [Marinobacter nanhaiticus D15-8W]|uniref:DUF748 domain-containing protein n=1 Tax=Marinobacter nanhaiticus D15-8W TaxID=626887 RepID=N6VXV5_9GAMM|nr:DUF748 domain-containing protein [Marinobacter nanhaiticus]ENO15110.1 DUF748 domain-containing protein [Marinobacter nanhaiticus D15-8W]BES69191.1 DUF748 domain-containing protein [Marinobacter nanhaiticus D15-8W]